MTINTQYLKWLSVGELFSQLNNHCPPDGLEGSLASKRWG